jgi:hypothetical protein
MPAAETETRTLRMKRDVAPAPAAVEPSPPSVDDVAADSGEDAPAPRRRGRPRKTPAAVEG